MRAVANGKLQRLLAHNKTVGRTDVQISYTVLLYKATNWKGAPRWRGPVKISGISSLPGGASLPAVARFKAHKDMGQDSRRIKIQAVARFKAQDSSRKIQAVARFGAP